MSAKFPTDALRLLAVHLPSEVGAEAGLFAAVSGILDGLGSVHAEAAEATRPEVEAIIQTRSRDRHRIEHTLDGLLAHCGDDEALALFKRLCRYYWEIDPAATAEYVYAHRDMWDNAGQADAAEPTPPQRP